MRFSKLWSRLISSLAVIVLALSWTVHAAAPVRALARPALRQSDSAGPVVRVVTPVSSQTETLKVSSAQLPCDISPATLSPVSVQGTTGLNLSQPASCFGLSLGTSFYSRFSVVPLTAVNDQVVSVATTSTAATVDNPYELRQHIPAPYAVVVPSGAVLFTESEADPAHFQSTNLVQPSSGIFFERSLAELQVFRC